MKKVAISSCCLLLTIAAAWVVAQENLPQGQSASKPLDARQYSYAIGLDIGGNFQKMDVELDLESLAAGVQAGLGGKDVKRLYDKKTCADALQQLQQHMQEKMRSRQQ